MRLKDRNQQGKIHRFLREESVFGNLGKSVLEKLAALARVRTVRKGKSLFCAGMPCSELHFLMEGRARVCLSSQEGRERLLHSVLPGEVIGAVPFFDRGTYPCTVVADVDSKFVFFRREDLLALLTRKAEVSLEIISAVIGRQRTVLGHLERMAFDDTSTRLWDYLVENSRPVGKSYPRILKPLPTRNTIANSIGTVREVVSRSLSHLVRSGHITIEGHTLTVLKPFQNMQRKPKRP